MLTAIGMLVQTVVAQEPPGVAGRFGTLDYRTAGSYSAAALSPYGMLVAVAGWQTITLTDLANGKRIGQFAEGDVILLRSRSEANHWRRGGRRRTGSGIA